MLLDYPFRLLRSYWSALSHPHIGVFMQHAMCSCQVALPGAFLLAFGFRSTVEFLTFGCVVQRGAGGFARFAPLGFLLASSGSGDMAVTLFTHICSMFLVLGIHSRCHVYSR